MAEVDRIALLNTLGCFYFWWDKDWNNRSLKIAEKLGLPAVANHILRILLIKSLLYILIVEFSVTIFGFINLIKALSITTSKS